MKVKISDSSERFDNIAFSNVIEDGKSLPTLATYICPTCKEKIGFTKNNIEEKSLENYSNLSLDHQSLFNETSIKNNFNNLHFLDWYCPRCNLPVRVYIKHWVGGHHGDAGVNILKVLELF
jgi:hypothetical protein